MQKPDFGCFDILFTPIIVCDSAGIAIYKNPAAKRRFPRPKTGYGIIKYLNDMDGQKYLDFCGEIISGNFPPPITIRLCRISDYQFSVAEIFSLASLLKLSKSSYRRKADLSRLEAIEKAGSNGFNILVLSAWHQMHFSEKHATANFTSEILSKLIRTNPQNSNRQSTDIYSKIESEIIATVNMITDKSSVIQEEIFITRFKRILENFSNELFSNYNFKIEMLSEDFAGFDFKLENYDSFAFTYFQLLLFALMISSNRSVSCTFFIIGGWLETEISVSLKNLAIFEKLPASGTISNLFNNFLPHSLNLNYVCQTTNEDNINLKMPYMYRYNKTTGSFVLSIKLKSRNNHAVEEKAEDDIGKKCSQCRLELQSGSPEFPISALQQTYLHEKQY